MINSYGFDGEIPVGAEYGVYDAENGKWTGLFLFTAAEAMEAESATAMIPYLSIEPVTEEGLG